MLLLICVTENHYSRSPFHSKDFDIKEMLLNIKENKKQQLCTGMYVTAVLSLGICSRFQRIKNYHVATIALATAGINRVLDEPAVRCGFTGSQRTFARVCGYV